MEVSSVANFDWWISLMESCWLLDSLIFGFGRGEFDSERFYEEELSLAD